MFRDPSQSETTWRFHYCALWDIQSVVRWRSASGCVNMCDWEQGGKGGGQRCWPKHGRLPIVDSKNTFGAKFWGKCEKQTFLQPNYQLLISANKYIIPLKSNKISLESIKMSESNCKIAQRSCIYLFILSRYRFLILSGINLTNVSEMYTTFRGCMDEENTSFQLQAIKKGWILQSVPFSSWEIKCNLCWLE